MICRTPERGCIGARTRRRALCTLLLCACIGGGTGGAPAWGEGSVSFPRLMGMNIGAKNYDEAAYQGQLARMDIVILGFHRGWLPDGYAASPASAMRKAVRAIKARNPGILVGQYTILNEAYDNPDDAASLDLRDKLDSTGWWLRNDAGRKVQWTADYAAWEVNFTAWARPDILGKRWPQWLAERNDAVFFRGVPEFDIVYLDNVMRQPRVAADWDADGMNDDPASLRMVAASHAGHLAHWQRIRELRPGTLLLGNSDGDLAGAPWRNQLDGAFLESLMGRNWSVESREGWPAMMARYRAVLRNTRPPGIVGFNVSGNPHDYRLLRYAYASCLLEDGYFSFTDEVRGYSSVPWFDEYDHELGAALSPAPTGAWSDGVWRRDFRHGVVLVNPTGEVRTVSVEPGLKRLAGKQDPAVNSGAAVVRVSLAPRDGIVLRR